MRNIDPTLYTRLQALDRDAYLLLTESPLQGGDYVEHTLYSVVRSLHKMMNQLEAENG